MALRLLAKELAARREQEEDRRRAQAHLVSVWPEYKGHEDPCLPWYVVVKNGSEEPVYDVHATVVSADSRAASDPDALPDPQVIYNDKRHQVVIPERRRVRMERMQWPLIPPGATDESEIGSIDISREDM